MLAVQRTRPRGIATQDPTSTMASGPARLQLRPPAPRPCLAADASLRVHLRLASELYMRLADLDIRATAEQRGNSPDTTLFARAFQHFKIGWDSERYRPTLPTDTTIGEDADVVLRRLAVYQYSGEREGYFVLDSETLHEVVKWALSLLRIYVCQQCEALTLGSCWSCGTRQRETR